MIDPKEELLAATAALAGAVSAYDKYVARRSRRGRVDPLFETRFSDMQRAVDRAREACQALASDGSASEIAQQDELEAGVKLER